MEPQVAKTEKVFLVRVGCIRKSSKKTTLSCLIEKQQMKQKLQKVFKYQLFKPSNHVLVPSSQNLASYSRLFLLIGARSRFRTTSKLLSGLRFKFPKSTCSVLMKEEGKEQDDGGEREREKKTHSVFKMPSLADLSLIILVHFIPAKQHLFPDLLD